MQNLLDRALGSTFKKPFPLNFYSLRKWIMIRGSALSTIFQMGAVNRLNYHRTFIYVEPRAMGSTFKKVSLFNCYSLCNMHKESSPNFASKIKQV